METLRPHSSRKLVLVVALLIVAGLVAFAIRKIAQPAKELSLSGDSAKAPTTQQLADARQKMQNRLLERSQLLNNLKQRYQFRLRDLTQDLRDKAIKLSIDGMGVPGRISTREIELTDLLHRQITLASSIDSTRAALAQAQDKKDKPDLNLLDKLNNDSRLNGYIQQLDEIDLKLAEGGPDADAKRLVKRKDALQSKIDKHRAELLESFRDARIESLKNRLEESEQAHKALADKVATTKQDLGDLTYQMSQYVTAVDEAKATRERLNEISRQLDEIAMANTAPDSFTDSELGALDRNPFAPAHSLSDPQR